MRDYGRVHIVELVVVRPRALGKPRIDYNFCVDFPHATWMQAVVQCCSYHSQKKQCTAEDGSVSALFSCFDCFENHDPFEIL